MRRRLAVAAVFVAVVGLSYPALAQIPAPGDPLDPTAAFFDDATVHDLKLWVNSRDWETLKGNYLSNQYYPADFVWRDQTVRNIGIRSRGTGSRNGFKPGLRVDFDRYASAQNFLGLKSFVLRNSVQDPSAMREWLSMQFFRRMGLPAPRESYARLFVNNEFAGLYMIVEAVDRSFLQRNLGENQGYLYDYDYDPTDLPFYFEDRGSNPDLYVPKPFKPATHEQNPRPEVVTQFVRTVNSTTGSVFRTAVAEFMDLAEFIRYVATEVFVADQDGFVGNWGMNNFYLYRPEPTNQFRLIVWDKSQAFVDGPTRSIWHNITDVPEANRNRLMSHVLEYQDLRALYLDTLVEAGVAAGAIPPDSVPLDSRGWMEREVERAYGLIAPTVRTDALKPYTNEEFELAVDALRQFARQRAAFVNLEVTAARGQP